MGRRQSHSKRRFSVNDDYFLVPGPQNAYWAGFLAADGCIVNDRALTLDLAVKDCTHLELFAETLEFNGAISQFVGSTGSRMCKVYITSPQIVENLRCNFGVTRRKTFTLEPPLHLRREHQIAYLLGYLDGDGYVGYDAKSRRFHISFIGTDRMMHWVKDVFDELAPVEKKVANVTYGSGYPKYAISGKRAARLLRLFATLALPRLERKKPHVDHLQINE